MKRISSLVLKCLLALCLISILSACSPVTQENFDKIQPDMTLTQVKKILGEPTSTENLNFAGASATAATWKNKDTEIDLVFLNDKVKVKNFKKSSDQKSNTPDNKISAPDNKSSTPDIKDTDLDTMDIDKKDMNTNNHQ